MAKNSIGIDLNVTPFLHTNDDTPANVNDNMVVELRKMSLDNKKLKEMLTLDDHKFLENHVNMSEFLRFNPNKRKLKECDQCNTSESMEYHHPGSSNGPNNDITRVYKWADSSDKSMVVNDGFKWRKYGQKKVTKDNYPGSVRAYYKCSFAPSCPVKKKVQRSVDDANLLVTTYEGEHNHDDQRMENDHNNRTSNKSFNSKIDQVLVEEVANSLKRRPDFIEELAEAIISKILKNGSSLS